MIIDLGDSKKLEIIPFKSGSSPLAILTYADGDKNLMYNMTSEPLVWMIFDILYSNQAKTELFEQLCSVLVDFALRGIEIPNPNE